MCQLNILPRSAIIFTIKTVSYKDILLSQLDTCTYLGSLGWTSPIPCGTMYIRTHVCCFTHCLITRVSPLLNLMDLENEFGFVASFPKNPWDITSTCFEAQGVSEGLVFP